MPEALVYLLRILLAVALGFFIGLERNMRAKEAGVRTHTIVAAASCLFMIISKYGFDDLDGSYDGSRIASQVVSGIGFLGAGIIIYHRQTISGMTTAAIIWATVGVGMAAGAGMYLVSVGATTILICVQLIMHIDCKLFRTKQIVQYQVSFYNTDREFERVKEIFCVKKFYKKNISQNDGKTVYNVILNVQEALDDEQLNHILKENPFIFQIQDWVEIL